MKPKPAGLEDHLGYWLRALSNEVSATFASRLERFGVSVPQWVVLRVLYNHSSLTLKELSVKIGVDPGALSRMIERLLVRGLLTRKTGLQSRREVAISLTTPGRQLVPRLAREADENDSTFFHSLTASERKTLLATIKTLLAANQASTSIPLN